MARTHIGSDHDAGPMLRRLLIDKTALEGAMLAAPDDQALRIHYLDLLRLLSAGHTGLSFARLPELAHPLYFRCGSGDLDCLASIFYDEIYGIEMLTSPARILDLGAHVGYAAIYLAHRFPTADILCVEPMSENIRLLLMNVLPYRRITSRNCAVWRIATMLSARMLQNGDFGVRLTEDDSDLDRTIPAFGVVDLLRAAGWASADLIKCSISGAEVAVFSDPTSVWLNSLDALIVETSDAAVAGASALLLACFDARLFLRRQYANKQVFERKHPFRALAAPEPAEIAVINPQPGILPMFVQDVSPVPWGFFVFDGHSCQLHPNFPGDGPPARAIFPRWFGGHTRITGSIRHAGELSPPIRYLVSIQTADNTILAQGDYVLAEGETQNFVVEFPALHGLHRVVLQTEMASEQTANAAAWARWIDLRLC